MTSRCVCCDQELEDTLATPSIALKKCRACGTWAAKHLQAGASADVWQGDTVTPEYLEVLLRRRKRQSHEILEHVRPYRGDGASLDYGCGQGVFLQALLEDGVNAYGCDISPSALEHAAPELRGRVSLVSEPWALPEGRHDTVYLLDVLEHCESPRELVSGLRAAGTDMLVVKVPVTEGPLFRIALGLAKLGRTRALEQLFLVGESAPHCSYFATAGIKRLFEACGYRTLQRFHIAEVGSELAVRLRGPSGRGNPIAGAVLGTAGGALELLGPRWSDTAVFICRLMKEQPAPV
jgi:hypothetical protein